VARVSPNGLEITVGPRRGLDVFALLGAAASVVRPHGLRPPICVWPKPGPSTPHSSKRPRLVFPVRAVHVAHHKACYRNRGVCARLVAALSTGTESCQVRHTGIVVSGQMTVRSDDATEVTVGPGDVFVMEPGHDAWVVGDEACVMTPGSRHTRNHPGRAGTDHHLSGSSDGKPGNRPAAEAVAGGKAPLTRRQHPLGPLRRTAVKSPP
jgi:hypothetical protein